MLRRVLCHARRQLRQLCLQARSERGRSGVKNVRARHARQGSLLRQRLLLLLLLLVLLRRQRRRRGLVLQQAAHCSIVHAGAPAARAGGLQQRGWNGAGPQGRGARAVVHLRSGGGAPAQRGGGRRGSLLRRQRSLPHVLRGGRVAVVARQGLWRGSGVVCGVRVGG